MESEILVPDVFGNGQSESDIRSGMGHNLQHLLSYGDDFVQHIVMSPLPAKSPSAYKGYISTPIGPKNSKLSIQLER
ncbi:hypothetical protein TNCV_2073351 [Trichonephila clavipes]|uniref:Uncharacterized protein n=1 Tax=Trichonephila clavipes TaxID=2585209 RepID=A0A8X6RDB5_TRICX|nr:hypothetical protein TNCV_2073351 [Trichonephila clavipes]